MKHVAVVGGGLVGSLAAAYLGQRGHQVDVYELRPDLRKHEIGAGRSINMALSDRGIKALQGVGAEARVLERAIPMNGRMMHAVDGTLTFQSYGLEDQAIYSISRTDLNAILMDVAEKNFGAKFHFDHKCTGVDLDQPELHFEHNNKPVQVSPDLIFGTDGAFSAVRRAMQKRDRFNFSQSYLEHGYKELCIPAAPDGSHQMEANALHIWPRGAFMLIALPNLDGSFTCTLFLPYEGEQSFASLNNDQAILAFFEETFPDALALMPDLLTDFKANPTGSLCTIKCFPWSNQGQSLLLGDASHGIVPFYGQGMNAGFEDCTVLFEALDKQPEQWDEVFKFLEQSRKPNADAIADLALQNFIEMRDLTGQPDFLLRKKIEGAFQQKHPDKWTPLYSMVTFSHTPYAVALAIGKKQKAIMDEVMALEGIHSTWESEEVEKFILDRLNQTA